MAILGLPTSILSGAFSALAGAAIYHLVSITIERQRLKRGLLLELDRNYQTLKGAEELVGSSGWDQKLHNRYQTQVFDTLTHRSAKIWESIDETTEIVEIYDQLEYLNDLQSASLVGGQSLDRDLILCNIRQAQENIEDVFPKLKRRWSSVGMNVRLDE
jgi:hypothetical protein